MAEPTNLERAMWAETALFAFNDEVSTSPRKATEMYDAADDVAKDLIRDLCHFLNLDERAGCMTPEQIMEMLESAFRLFEMEKDDEEEKTEE